MYSSNYWSLRCRWCMLTTIPSLRSHLAHDLEWFLGPCSKALWNILLFLAEPRSRLGPLPVTRASSEPQPYVGFLSTISTFLAALFCGQSWLVYIYDHFSPGRLSQFCDPQNEQLWSSRRQDNHLQSVEVFHLLLGTLDIMGIVPFPFYICVLPSFHVLWGLV